MTPFIFPENSIIRRRHATQFIKVLILVNMLVSSHWKANHPTELISRNASIVTYKMQTQNWILSWRMTLMTCAMLLWFGMAVPISGQCFTDNDNSSTVAISDAGASTEDTFEFALGLFKSVVQPPSLPPSGNCHISQLSVRLALITTYLGARGTTKTELQTVLRPGKGNQMQVLGLFQSFKDSLAHNATESANYTIRIADKLYFDNNVKLRQCIAEYMKPELEQVDFRSAPDQSRQNINKWVEEITNNKIANLLPPSSITSQTTMVIVNALYLKAAWTNIFNPLATYEDDFFVEPQRSKRTSMMHQLGTFGYASSSQLDCTVVELPYSGNDISMVILLPNSKAQDLINKLSAKKLIALLGKLSPVRVWLTLPKFKITQTFELTQNLKSLGIKELFDSARADLSGFTGAKNVFVTSVHHKTFIETNEGGTEAAAATAIVVGTTSVIVEDVSFNVNRPFVFMIRHIKRNVILFMGLIKDPTVQD